MSILLTLIFVRSSIGLTTLGQTCDLRVEMPRHTVEVIEGESETLECEYYADGSCNIDYLEWCISRDGIECSSIVHITDSGPSWFNDYGDYYSTDGNNLVIDEAETLHEGEYRCIVEDWNGNTGQESLNLFVLAPFAPINISISVDKLPVIEGNDVLLTCTANGVPTPTYDWTQNGVELSDRNKYQINEDGSELTILSITKHEGDYYNCTATNEKGSDATAVFIDVYYEPNTGWPLCEVHVETNEEYIAEGDFAELTCKATGGNPPPHLEWYNYSEALPECTSSTDDDDVVTKTVTCWQLTPYDNGNVYECKGKHDATEETPNCFTEVFDIKYSPTWQTCSHTEGDQFEEEDDFTLTCTSNGNPLATLQWVNGTDSAILLETNGYDDDETAINEYSWKLTRGDNQVFFECHAFNDIRQNILKCRTAPLIVHFAPLSLWLTGNTDTARKGNRLELSCVTDSSNPVSTISWYKNDQLITDDDHEEIQEEDVRDGSFHGKVTEGGLHFHVLASNNENEYSCKTTRFGYSDEDLAASVTIYVHFPPSEPEGCTTTLTGYSTPVVEGDDLVLTCTSCSGNPTPIIEWFEDEHKMEAGLGDISNSSGYYHGEVTVQDLTLHLTYQHHGQIVRCESFNEEFAMENDRVISNDVILDVYYAPFVRNEEENQRHAVNLTDNADLTCEINSNPEVKISWYDNNNETITNGTGKFLMHGSTTDTITTGVLTILNVSESDFGDYRCHGINNINEVNFSIHLSGKRRPYPAYDVTVTNKTEDSLTLSWTPGYDGGLSQQFVLEYLESDVSKGTPQRTQSTTNTTDRIRGLLAMTVYHIRVVSFNKIGESHSDQRTTDSTLPTTPKLENVRATTEGELTISLPPGACVKIEMSNGTHWIDYFISHPCDDEVTITLQGSGELHIYFCTDSTYAECGVPFRYTYAIVPSTSWAIAVPILISLIIATSIAVAVLAILVWRNASENKLVSDHGMRYAPHNEYYETTDVDNGLLPRQTNQGTTDFSSMVNTAMSPEADEDNSKVDKDDSTRYAIFSNIKKDEQDPQTSKSTEDTYAVVDKSHPKTSVTDQTNAAQYAKVDIKKKKKKSGQTIDVYSKVDKIKDKKTAKTGQLNEDTEGGMTSDAIDPIPPFLKGGEFAYANVPAVKGKPLPTATESTVDNSAYEYVDLKKNTRGSKTGTKTKADNGDNGTSDGVYGKDHKSSNVASQNSDAGHSLKEKNVEGLVYADLDLKPTSKPKRAPKKLPAETVDYAAIDFTNKN